MRTPAVALSALACAAAALAEQVLREYPWEKTASGGLPQGAQLAADGPGRAYDRLAVENPTGQPLTLTLLTIEDPPIAWATYAVVGFVRHEGVEGEAYLEMRSHFPDGSAPYSRTLAQAGPMRHLEGTAGWRAFTLPFYSKQGAPPPVKLVVGLVLPGRGIVHLSGLRLAQYLPGEDPLAAAVGTRGWWGDATGGIIGGVLGALGGCLGALVGFLASKGRARGPVLAGVKVAFVLGLALVLAGVAAVMCGQPYAVYYPLLLAGGLCAILSAGLLPTLRRRYAELELRRMQAADASGAS